MENGLSTDVEEIDRVLRGYPWLDCEVHALLQGRLLIVGGVDLHGPPPDVLLHFEDVVFMSVRSEWTTDTSRPVLSLLDGDEEAALRLAFHLGGEHTIFEMWPEDLEGRCRIAARSVRMTQMRRPETPLKLPMEWSGGGA